MSKQKRSRKVYIVTRLVRNSQWGTAVPNLGVHSSLASAQGHFDSVKKDRLEHGYRCWWDRSDFTEEHPCRLARAAYFDKEYESVKREWSPDSISEKKTEIEELRIEVWRI